MKQFLIAGAFAIAGLILPGQIALAQQQNVPPAGQPTTVGQAGASGQSEAGKQAKAAKGAGGAADEAFAKEAAEGGLAEVELGKLATQNAGSDDVKKFGQRMVDDHSKANDQLKDTAQKLGMTLPSQLSAKDNATKARLEKLNGAAFDRAYMADMVRDHTKDVAAFQKEARSGSNADIKQFASSTLPTLESHLKEAKSVDAKVRTSEKPEPKAKKSPK